MFNLLVSADKSEWEGPPFDLEQDRFGEYTSEELVGRFSELTTANITALGRLPCVLAYETFVQQDPKLGKILRIDKRQGKIRVHYELQPVSPFLTHADLERLRFELDIDKWEMNRTHWAIKDVNLPLALSPSGIELPAWAAARRPLVDVTTHVFDVALSFPGEIRPYVEQVAKLLERDLGPNAYFYDNNYKSQLARPNLDTLLQGIYRERSRLVVVFVCAAYGKKDWCGLEFRAIRDIIKSKHDKVMFVRTDKGKVEGVFDVDGYVDAMVHTPEEVARMIVERVELLP